MTPEEELDFQWVVGRIRALNDLVPPPPKVSRIAPPAVDDLVGDSPSPSTSYTLPRSKMVQSLVEDANAVLALDPGCFKETKKRTLIQPSKPRRRRYYTELGCSGNPATLNTSMTDLLKVSLDRASKKDVSLSVAEAKELEGSISSSRAITSWLDLWLRAFGRSTLDPTVDVASIKRLIRSGSKALFFLAQQINTVWFNLRLKRRDAALESLVSGCAPEDSSALRNGIVDGSDNLFPEEIVREVSDRYQSRLEKAAIRKAVSSSASSGKRKPSPANTSSAPGRPAKVQKPPVQVTAPSGTSGEKDAQRSFPKTPGRGRGKQKSKGKKQGGSN